MSHRLEATLMAGFIAALATGALVLEPWPDILRVRQQFVRFGDLDLANPADVAVLHARVRVAAVEACVLDGRGSFANELRIRCRIEMTERAVTGLPAAVQAYHAQWKADAFSAAHPSERAASTPRTSSTPRSAAAARRDPRAGA